jgi:Resolvase, N terminal domain
MMYGYARVSSETQCFNGQIEALKAAGAEQIFAEKFTGKAANDRKQLQAMLAKVREGDVVVVCKLDRFARSSLDLQTMLKDLDNRGVKFKSLGDPIFDTTTPQGKLMMQVLAAFAEFDRNMIRERCSAGIARAHAQPASAARGVAAAVRGRNSARRCAIAGRRPGHDCAACGFAPKQGRGGCGCQPHRTDRVHVATEERMGGQVRAVLSEIEVIEAGPCSPRTRPAAARLRRIGGRRLSVRRPSRQEWPLVFHPSRRHRRLDRLEPMPPLPPPAIACLQGLKIRHNPVALGVKPWPTST